MGKFDYLITVDFITTACAMPELGVIERINNPGENEMKVTKPEDNNDMERDAVWCSAWKTQVYELQQMVHGQSNTTCDT